jgi:hypothetical protein
MRATEAFCSFLALVVLSRPVACTASTVRIFPEPQEIHVSGAPFVLDENVSIILPQKASEADLRLASLLSAELSDRHGFAIRVKSVQGLPTGRRIVLIGTISNPLVKEYCTNHHLELNPSKPGPEGYVLSVTRQAVVVAGCDEPGAFYGLQSLRQLIESYPGGLRIPGVTVRDWPFTKFRGVKLYLPGREDIAFFHRFVRDFMALYKYNKLLVEMNATMRLDRHPELNTGSLEFARDLLLRRLNVPPGLWYHGVNSSHYDVADGGILEKHEVADLVRWAEQNYIEVIPELPSLTHSYYLLNRHRELAEIPQEEWPDTYCPSLPAVYSLLFDVYDEYISVMKPKMVNIGHDEWRMPWGVCPRCRNKDPRQLYAQDVNKIHDFLKGKGIRTTMWGDHLLENVRGVKLSKPWWDAPSYDYKIPGALSPEQVARWIPKDILMFNWLWSYTDDPKYPPVTNEERLSDWGFEQIYGNFEPTIENFSARVKRSKIIGGAPSAWLASNEFNFGKDLIADFIGCAELVWSGRERIASERTNVLARLMPDIRRNLSGYEPPSATEAVVPIDISRHFNSRVPGTEVPAWQPGPVNHGRLVFELGDPAANEGKVALVVGSQGNGHNPYVPRSGAISIGRDASSLVFLHALAQPAASVQGYRRIFDFADSADLLGWYEVVYEDGLVTTIPLRYHWNILDLKNQAGVVAYQADSIDCGHGNLFYAFEWTNPRLGVVIKEIRLSGSAHFKNPEGTRIPSNAIILAGVSVVPKREKPEQQVSPFPQRE